MLRWSGQIKIYAARTAETVQPRIARMNTDDGGRDNPTSSEGASGTAGVRRLSQIGILPVQAPVVTKNYLSNQGRAP
jgi:hypothetical protein